MGETNCLMGFISLLYTVSFKILYYYIVLLLSKFLLFSSYHSEHSKNLLVECAASHLKNKKFTTTYGSRLDSSSGRILLQSVPGMNELKKGKFGLNLKKNFSY